MSWDSSGTQEPTHALPCWFLAKESQEHKPTADEEVQRVRSQAKERLSMWSLGLARWQLEACWSPVCKLSEPLSYWVFLEASLHGHLDWSFVTDSIPVPPTRGQGGTERPTLLFLVGSPGIQLRPCVLSRCQLTATNPAAAGLLLQGSKVFQEPRTQDRASEQRRSQCLDQSGTPRASGAGCPELGAEAR
uniref:Uncharacterized protein n=1 Tax=Molossus molossus TaxID=27622 RepID=A0A7J8GLM6_MOLMO|nr:hypothetical protein HJG59_011417 [Molossus molossus]